MSQRHVATCTPVTDKFIKQAFLNATDATRYEKTLREVRARLADISAANHIDLGLLGVIAIIDKALEEAK